MKLHQLFEASEQDEQKYHEWQRACRSESESCQFTGSCSGGAQAVDWDSSNNRCVGDWDGKTKTGTVHKLKKPGV